VGADGIAISPDGKTLYYCPLTSRHLYSVSIDALADRTRFDAEVAATVKDLGEKGGASDGLESDAEGRVYLSDYEHDAIRRWTAAGMIETLDPRVLGPTRCPSRRTVISTSPRIKSNAEPASITVRICARNHTSCSV